MKPTKKNKHRTGFVQIYNAFLDSDKLTPCDKMVFIAIKSFSDNLTKKAFPSLATISRISGVSVAQVRRSVEKMQGLNILKVEKRTDPETNGRISNLYTLYDAPNMWNDDFTTETEDMQIVARELPDDILKAEYERRYKKEHGAADQSKTPCTYKNISTPKYKKESGKSQSGNKFKNFPERQYSSDEYQMIELAGMRKS